MVTQSRTKPVPLLLTRPEAQGAAFADDLQARFGDQLRVIKSPLLAPRFFVPSLPTRPVAALIVTSRTGVEAYARLGAATNGLPREVFCVGESTARAAKEAHLLPQAIADDAAQLIAQIKARKPDGALLHLRGRETRGDILFHLNSAGIETIEAITYAQEAGTLTPQATTLLQQGGPVLVPLFSPRTASVLASELHRIAANSALFIAAISAGTALELPATGAQVRIAARPDAASMLKVVAMLLADVRRA